MFAYSGQKGLYGALMQMVDILACHARYTGSSPVGVAIKVDSQYLVAENLGVEEETKESLYLATVFWA